MCLTVGMFADHIVPLEMDYPAARARFLWLAHGDLLDSLSRDAYADGLAGEVRVGPFGSVPGLSKLVRVSLLVPIRWEATGRTGRLFPVLDANLILGPDDRGQAVLRITGVYRPPLAGLGDALDQAVLHRVAAATMRSLLRRIAALLAGPAAEATGQDALAPGLASGDVSPEVP